MNATLDSPKPFQFRLHHIVYVVALLGASLVLTGPFFLLVTVAIAIFWAQVFKSKTRLSRICTLAIYLSVIFAIWYFFVLSMEPLREPNYRGICRRQAFVLGRALENYQSVHGLLPPLIGDFDEKSTPHSWRVDILPLLEANDLFVRYRFDESWNGPNNKKLFSSGPRALSCPCSECAAVPGLTSYFRVGDVEGKQIRNCGILVLEANHLKVKWSEPRDLSFDEAFTIITSRDPKTISGHRRTSFFYDSCLYTRSILLSDGYVVNIRGPLPKGLASRVLAADANPGQIRKEIEDADVEPYFISRYRWENVIPLAIYALIAFSPLPWIFRQRGSSRINSSTVACHSLVGESL